jgi:Na+/proline symporter
VIQGGAIDEFRSAQRNVDDARAEAQKLAGENDTNYIFLSFVTQYLPRGIVGLVIGVIFTAAMSASSGEINSLATVTMVDVYKRHFHREGTDRHYLLASRVATVFWGCYAIAFANFAPGFGALIEAVNQVGSLFYGSMLGVFVLAFFAKRVDGTGAFWGVLLGQAAIFAVARYTPVAYLWYNVVGCLVVVAAGLAISAGRRRGTLYT